MAPTKRKVSKNQSSGGSDDEDYRKKRSRNNQNDITSTDGEGNDYRVKRERNNEAVKRSRVKSKQKTCETKDRVDNLKYENQRLDAAIHQKQENLKTLKELFLETAKVKSLSSDSNINLQKLLADSDDEDNKPGRSG